MKKSPSISNPVASTTTLKGNIRRNAPGTQISPQRRILSLSSTNNKASSVRGMTEFPGARKTSWQKRIGGMLSGLTSSSSNNKENNDGSGGSVRSIKSSFVEDGEIDTGNDVLGLGVPAGVVRGRSVSERTK